MVFQSGNNGAQTYVVESHTPTDFSYGGSTRTGSSKSNSGSSKSEPATVTSTWRIGWQVPSLMITCYLLSIAIALAHLLLFRHIDGKDADGPFRVAPQSHITTASNILANAFGFVLRTGLAVAFVQYMWHMFRQHALKVSTIELMYSIRTNLFMLFMPAVIKAAPVLCAMAAIMWAAQIVISFPPGALTIGTAQRVNVSTMEIPTFDASFMGNGSAVEANAYSMIPLTPYFYGFTTGAVGEGSAVKDGNLLSRLARQVLISGESLSTQSPCGPNCTYTTEFEGPWVSCNNSRSQVTFKDASQGFAIYEGDFVSAPGANLVQSLYNGTYTLGRFNTTTLLPLKTTHANKAKKLDSSVLVQQDKMTCVPGRAKHTVKHVYENNIYKRTIESEPIEPLRNLALTTYQGIIAVGKFADIHPNETGFFLGTEVAEWSPETLAYYRDNNHNAIITAMASLLAGQFIGTLPYKVRGDVVDTNKSTSTDLAWQDVIFTTRLGRSLSESANGTGTVIESTRFNNASNKYTAFDPVSPSFNMTEAVLNEYLFNMTTAMMTAYGNWKTTVPVTRTRSVTVFRFSEPLNLILPYFLMLAASLPFIVLGCVALVRNGVSAIDNSFVQMLVTSTGSATLDKAAAGGCLGGDESVPEELMELKIRFGEIISRDKSGTVKRAGFGVEDEVTSLTKGARYGITRWV